jgi:hypothetical protein
VATGIIVRIVAAMLAVTIHAGKGPSINRVMPVQLEKSAYVQKPMVAR